MPIPDYQGLMLAVLRHGAEGETGVMQVEEKIATELGMTTEEREQMLPSGKQRVLHNRIHWAKFYLYKAVRANQTEFTRGVGSGESRASQRTVLFGAAGSRRLL